ncbi:hypothetical protein [Nannocystis sp.]|uniref:hypothetical protein n=1 Tax=Nannocystis sp. TaxID=1962667 RepID=UPI00344FC75D
MNDLALLQQVRGSTPEAQALLERALVIAEAAWGRGPDAATILNNLRPGPAYARRLWRGPAAPQAGAGDPRALLAPDDLELATSLQYLGLLHMVRGDLGCGPELLGAAWRSARAASGSSKPRDPEH